MNKTAVAAVALAGTAALSGAALVPGSAAPDRAAHVLRFASVDGPSHQTGKFSFVQSDVDKRAGKVIGYDALSGSYSPKTQVATINVAVALKGGLITVRIAQQGDAHRAAGTITGGKGKYAGISGTIHTVSKAKKTLVTLRYTL